MKKLKLTFKVILWAAITINVYNQEYDRANFCLLLITLTELTDG